ncbi:MAG TPA: hypothetical protein VK887_01040 [Pseudonocardiaceae bacterium]|nr:hypothetical protein [Pseudonocardiaceae bacterium]
MQASSHRWPRTWPTPELRPLLSWTSTDDGSEIADEDPGERVRPIKPTHTTPSETSPYDIGASLKYATVKVNRAERTSGDTGKPADGEPSF